MLWEAGSRLSRSRCIIVRQRNVPTESFYMGYQRAPCNEREIYLFHKWCSVFI